MTFFASRTLSLISAAVFAFSCSASAQATVIDLGVAAIEIFFDVIDVVVFGLALDFGLEPVVDRSDRLVAGA